MTQHNTIKFSYRYVVDTLLGMFQIRDIQKTVPIFCVIQCPFSLHRICTHCVKVNSDGKIIVPPNGSSPHPTSVFI
jgi:hypothetical protein